MLGLQTVRPEPDDLCVLWKIKGLQEITGEPWRDLRVAEDLLECGELDNPTQVHLVLYKISMGVCWTD